MSIIFDTLQKLKKREEGVEGKGQAPRKRANVYTFQRLFFSAPAMLIIGALVAAGLLAVFYGIEQYTSRKQQNASLHAPVMAKKTAGPKENPLLKPPQPKKEANLNEVPAPPAPLKVREVRPGQILLPGRKSSPPADKSTHEARYLPPLPVAAEKRGEPAGTLLHGERSEAGGQGGKLRLTEKSPSAGPRPPGVSPDAAEALPEEVGVSSRTKVAALPPGPAAASERMRAKILSERSQAGKAWRTEKARGTEGKASLERAKRSVPTSETPSRGGKPAVLKQKNARIRELVDKIQAEFSGAPDRDRVEGYLKDLGTLKGEDDPYVMKLRAYWHMRQGHWGEASVLLRAVLERDAQDLEAGLNMAVIEARSGMRGQAVKRLRRLRDLYPAEGRVVALLARIIP